ncbi:nuclear transport factor 2 family protein [Methylobacillus methanolivorans]
MSNNDFKATAQQLNQAWDAAFNAKDHALVTSFYDDAATVLPAGAAQITGKEALLGFWKTSIAQGIIDHKLELLEAGADANLAFQRGHWSAAVIDAQGNRQSFNGNVHLLYKKQADGNWKLFSHIWN